MALTLPKLPFNVLITSRQLISGKHVNDIGGLLTSFAGNITALAGGGQAACSVLNAAYNELTTVATNGDSVQLPISQVGLCVEVTNSGVASAQVFGNIADPTSTIQGTIGTTGVALAAAASAIYVCTKIGVWKRFASA